MSIDSSVISYALRYEAVTDLQRHGIELDDFIDDEYRAAWRYIIRTKRDHDVIVSEDTFRTRFPDIDLPRVRRNELPVLLHDLRKRRKYVEMLRAVDDVARRSTSFDQVDDLIQELTGKLNSISFTGDRGSHIVDLFNPATSRRIEKELAKRRRGEVAGIPSGLKRFDVMAGGLMKQKMITAIGRSGIGKSWIDLLFVASAVENGQTVILYPLEMTLFETAARLYTIFSARSGQPVLKNYDLTSGRVPLRQVKRFMAEMNEKYEGRLLVADVSSLSDPYTIERIEAEVESYKPDMFWVDYLTLLKPPAGSRDDGDHIAIRRLSNGIKNIAMRRNVIGGCSAQVNREAVRNNVFLPRLEHIAYGDAIGQDSDQVFSLNRKGNDLYYALVKNRGGVEFGKTRLKFFVNEGILSEYDEPYDED